MTTERRLCFFLVCFQSLEYVQFLIGSLYRPSDLFVVHCDPKAPRALRSYVKALKEAIPNVIVLDSQSYSWAGYSHVDVSFKAINAALNEKNDWAHFIFLSEQHLPLNSPEEIARDLPPGRSVFAFERAARYSTHGRADVLNRFSCIFRELPGVGCFATRIRTDPNPEQLLASAYHGSNWIALSRRHCERLIDMQMRGLADIYQTIVHPEELIFHTLLSDCQDDIDARDIVLVAFPHLGGDSAMVMTDDLFKSALSGPYLFIRKRPRLLSPDVEQYVKGNHFFDLKVKDAQDDEGNHELDASAATIKTLDLALRKTFHAPISIEWLDSKKFAPSPQIHVKITHKALPSNVSIRVISEDIQSFKVAIVESVIFPDIFDMPEQIGDYIKYTIRSRVYDLFGNVEILPMSTSNAGFLDKLPAGECAELLELIRTQIKAAIIYFVK